MNSVPANLTVLVGIAAQRLSDAVDEVRDAALDLAKMEALMASAPDLSKATGGKSIPDISADYSAASRQIAERAGQDAKANNLAQRVVSKASGGTPKALGEG